MTDRPDERAARAADPNHDDAFLRRLRDAWVPPPMSAARRARFDAALDARIARERWRFAPWVAAAVAGGAAALLLVSRLGPLATPAELAEDTTPEEAYALALVGDADDFEAALPADYRAIAGMLDAE